MATENTIVVVTRIEEEDQKNIISKSLPPIFNEDIVVCDDIEPLEEDDDEYFNNFDPDLAWETLIQSPDCTHVCFSEEQQKQMGLEVGVHVSSEFPWKMLKFRVLRNHIFEEMDNADDLREKFQNTAPDDDILIGFCEKLSEDNEIFLVFDKYDSAKWASEIIKNLEGYDRWFLNSALNKKARQWITEGSDKDVDMGLPEKPANIIDVEIQRVYPIIHSNTAFSNRCADDARDGYVELIPGSKRYENVTRKTIDVGIQSAPAKIDLEQQTDPTFPSNAWSQYLYEINPDDDGLDKSDDERKREKDETKKGIMASSRPGSPVKTMTPIEEAPTPVPELSNQVKSLIQTLEFNQVDMYRNDYPRIARSKVPKYTIPYLEEILGFANISKSLNRFVCGVDWYPTISGLVVTSYTFNTIASTIKEDEKEDRTKRIVTEPNPVLMWGFDDTLHFKLEFEAPREITYLCFCPYDENILIGGMANGQIVIWDLQDRISKAEVEEILTAAQTRYRNIMRQFLDWTKPMNQHVTVRPAAISALESSHTGPIVIIKFLNRHQYITATGQARQNLNEKYRYFFSSSIDGTVAFWNLDIQTDQKRVSSGTQKKMPSQLVQDVSEYKKLDRIFKPQYVVATPMPISSVIFDRGFFHYKPNNIPSRQQRKISIKLPIKVTGIQQNLFRQGMICGSLTGGVHNFSWEGFDFVQNIDINREALQIIEEYAHIHDGPVLVTERNPFYSTLFASIGRTVLAVWKEGFLWTPILWRKRPAALTCVKWSFDRPSVLFLTRSDGVFEVWDFLAQTDAPILMDMLSGSIITAISEHRPAIPRKVLGIGDFNSSFRMLILPKIFERKKGNELLFLESFVDKEVERKTILNKWKMDWLEKNVDIIQAKKLAAEAGLVELEKLRKDQKDIDEDKIFKKEVSDHSKSPQKDQKKLIFDLPEKLEKKWDEMNLKRLMNVLMSRKFVDPIKLASQTALEKDRLAYIKNKKIAIKKSFRKIDEEIAAVRARLLPTEPEDLGRIEMVREAAKGLVEAGNTYDEIETEALEFFKLHPQDAEITYSEFLERGRLRRLTINKSLGANMVRRYFYKHMKREGILDNAQFGIGQLYDSIKQSTTAILSESLVDDQTNLELTTPSTIKEFS